MVAISDYGIGAGKLAMGNGVGLGRRSVGKGRMAREFLSRGTHYRTRYPLV